MWIIEKNCKGKAYFSIYDISGEYPSDDNIIALLRIDLQTGSQYAHSKNCKFSFKNNGRKFILLDELKDKDKYTIIERVFRKPQW